jgi:hypothetical protein|tara:strand:- start:1 stop:426 length:426 start_codon:yes stop_codon:yes gene_type:complete
MEKIKISEANLYNCEGFMFEVDLVDKINTFFKHKSEYGMTLKELSQIQPRDFLLKLGKDQEPVFTKSEVKKIIKLLSWFNLTPAAMATCEVVDQDGRIRQYSNVDHELPKVLPDAEQEALDKAAETTYQITKDFEPEILEQ